jgi:hypothetical protein
MPTTKAAKRVAHRSSSHRSSLWPLRPQFTGVAALLTVVAAVTVCAATLPRDFVLPAMSMLFFILAAMVALAASSSDRADDDAGLTHSDIAGLLTFIGICAASQVDPDQMVRLVEGANREP